MRLALSLLLIAAACTDSTAPVVGDPAEESGDGKSDAVSGMADVRCEADPDVGEPQWFRHVTSELIAAIGPPQHRGIDLVASASSASQVIAGELAYGYELVDKGIGDEDVDVFACRQGTWQSLGRVRTDPKGRFSLTLSGNERLPLGVRDMFLSVVADRTSARFLAVVAPDHKLLAVSDVDGTLTGWEYAYIPGVVGLDPEIHDGAAAAWRSIASRGFIPVYVTARARFFTDVTRDWLTRKMMPRGPLRLASGVLLPGHATVDYKATTFGALQKELTITLGVGNRTSDIDAYSNAGLDGDHIFIKLPEYADEVRPRLDAGDAIGFAHYADLNVP